jgi:large subunit ribosomal protein L13
MKTYSPKPQHIERRWYVVDAGGQVLGRVASEVATILRGKHKPMYAPHMDTGDHVVVVNADKIELTGNKGENKYAYHHSGYPGGIRAVRYKDLMATRPVAAVEKAVRGMLPKNSLGRQMLKKLHVVPGPEHPHAAQSPVALALGERPQWLGLPTPKAAAPTPKPRAPKAELPADDEAAPKAKSAAKAKSTAKPKSAAKRKSTAKAKSASKAKTPAKRTSTTKATKTTAKPKTTRSRKTESTEE